MSGKRARKSRDRAALREKRRRDSHRCSEGKDYDERGYGTCVEEWCGRRVYCPGLVTPEQRTKNRQSVAIAIRLASMLSRPGRI
jgi:hypothetical protein